MRTKCESLGCLKRMTIRGRYCTMHKTRLQRHGILDWKPITIKQRFMQKVKKSNGCWEWMAFKQRTGYGRFTVNKISRYAPRVSYELFRGPIPDGLFVCHSCDNPSCVNPGHLWLGTTKDNALDKIRKGRHQRCDGEFNGQAIYRWDLVREIRKLHSDGIRQNELMRRYGIKKGTIWAIVNGKIWKETKTPLC